MERRYSFGDVLWLARREIVRLRFSYLLTGFMLLIMGGLTASTIEAGALGSYAVVDRWETAFFADIAMLLMTSLLATNLTLWGSFADWSNPSERKLAFFRELPIPVRTLIASRMLSMAASLIIAVPALFVPLHLFVDHQLGFGAYLWFILFWVGYGLLWAGINLYMEFVKGGRFAFAMSGIAVMLIILLVGLLGAGLDVYIVASVGDLAQSYGPLIAFVSIVIGAMFFVLFARIAERGLQMREIPV
jgi:hypothetical protein